MKILYTDDDLFMQQFVSSLLEPHYEIDTCESGKSLFEYLESRSLPDLIILDINLPDMTGIEILKECKRRVMINDIPILMLSGEDKSNTRIECLSAGADDFVIKPFHPEELALRVRKILDGVQKKNPDIPSHQKGYKKTLGDHLLRSMDILSAGSLLLVLSPLLLLIAALIKLESPGPVFYVSPRVGRNYRIFPFLKFRSMRTGADAELTKLKDLNQYAPKVEQTLCPVCGTGPCQQANLLADNNQHICEHLWKAQKASGSFFKIARDPRITRLGHFLRKTSLDELPQLFNVLKGDMSLVGNRPLPLYEAEKLTRDGMIKRFDAPAGITGLWQVTKRGKKGDMSEEERMMLDAHYAQHRSFWLDIKILFKTIPALLQEEDV